MGASSGQINRSKQEQNNPHVLGLEAKLLAFNINTYDYQGQLTDHKEIEALIQTPRGYCIIRLSYANNGLTTYSMTEKRETPPIKCQKYEISKGKGESAWISLRSIAFQYCSKPYSLLFNNCQTFVKDAKLSLKFSSYENYLDVWEIYDNL